MGPVVGPARIIPIGSVLCTCTCMLNFVKSKTSHLCILAAFVGQHFFACGGEVRVTTVVAEVRIYFDLMAVDMMISG